MRLVTKSWLPMNSGGACQAETFLSYHPLQFALSVVGPSVHIYDWFETAVSFVQPEQHIASSRCL